jgi:tight adherence protein B
MLAAMACAAVAAVVLAGRPSPLRTRLKLAPDRRQDRRGGHVGRIAWGTDGSPRRDSANATGNAAGGADHGAAIVRQIILRLRARLTGRRQSQDHENDVAEICLALSAELRSGVPLGQAVAAVSYEWPDLLGDVAGQAAIGGDVAAAFRIAAGTPGAGALAAIATGWEVSERTGAPLSRVLLAVADALRMAATARREADSQLATVRTTARLMAVLPFGTLLMLSGGDQEAARFLITTPVGLACLGLAAVFVSLGLWWVGRVARSVAGTSWTA